MTIVQPTGELFENFDVVQRMTEAWNPPDVSGAVSITKGNRRDTLQLYFRGARDGRTLMIFSKPLDRRLFDSPEHRKIVAEHLRDFLLGVFDRAPVSAHQPTHLQVRRSC